MKKLLRIALVIIALVIIAFYALVLPKTVSMITDYPRYTFEQVTSDTALIADYAIGENRTPADYGYVDYIEVNYQSLTDDVSLNGWFVPATKDSIDRTLVISHGRTSNRLKTMKYLELIKSFGLDSLYNVFIPDHRNSGKSQEASTAMGYEFAEDVGGAVKMLNSRYDQHHFVLWGFSMGAMAGAAALDREEVQDLMTEQGLSVDKLVLSSPLSNVYMQLKTSSQQMGIPGFIFNQSYNRFNEKYDGRIDDLKLSHLLSAHPVATLVLYGNADTTTPASILEGEIKGLPNVSAHMFEGAEHVQLYTQPEHKARYGQLVNDFLRE